MIKQIKDCFIEGIFERWYDLWWYLLKKVISFSHFFFFFLVFLKTNLNHSSYFSFVLKIIKAWENSWFPWFKNVTFFFFFFCFPFEINVWSSKYKVIFRDTKDQDHSRIMIYFMDMEKSTTIIFFFFLIFFSNKKKNKFY